MKRLCTICARGGSKGVPNKNVRIIGGRPLIAHSVLQAKASMLFDLVAVSSDSDEILAAATAAGADLVVRRPDEMATDSAAKMPAIQHCVAEVERRTGIAFDTFVDLDATSPLRLPSDIAEVVRLLEEKGVSNVITAMPARRSPYFNMVELTPEGVAVLSKPLPAAVVRRQDAPKVYDMNGSVYAWRRDALLSSGLTPFLHDTALYVMPEERSIDIDTETDFAFVQFMFDSGRSVPAG